MKFWTALQAPLFQAALIEDGRIVRTIPSRTPRTPADKVFIISSFDGNLVIGRKNSIELWSADAGQQLRHLYHKWFHLLHAAEQIGERLLVVSSGLDLIFTVNWDGEVGWSWWGHENGLCSKPHFVDSPDWQSTQLINDRIVVEDNLHMNSAWLDGNRIFVSMLRRDLIAEIPVGGKGFLMREHSSYKGCHSPILTPDGLVFGTERGVCVNGSLILQDYQWVKFIRKVPGGYVFTHMEGVCFVDDRWRVRTSWMLPAPFGITLIEE